MASFIGAHRPTGQKVVVLGRRAHQPNVIVWRSHYSRSKMTSNERLRPMMQHTERVQLDKAFLTFGFFRVLYIS
jgi:hypothetical protein